MDVDEREYCYFGRRIEQEETTTGYRKAFKDPHCTKSLPVWNQEVTDSRGRKRFHGAFTGGYSAGYFNSVGSAEGWKPTEFSSSRGKRAAVNTQSIEQFLDTDELDQYNQTAVSTKYGYDTFGGAASDALQKQILEESRRAQGGEEIPSLAPREMFEPICEGIGVQLLNKMGWRQGKGIEEVKQDGRTVVLGPGYEDLQQKLVNRKMFREDSLLEFMAPKMNKHGLGYDPFAGAEEFRRAKTDGSGRTRKPSGLPFGLGSFEEDDTIGTINDYGAEEEIFKTDRSIDFKTSLFDNISQTHDKRLKGKPSKRLDGDTLDQLGYSFEIQDVEGETVGELSEKQNPMLLKFEGEYCAKSSREQKTSNVPYGFSVAHVAHNIEFFKVHKSPVIPQDFIPSTPKYLSEDTLVSGNVLEDEIEVPAELSLRQQIDQFVRYVVCSSNSVHSVLQAFEGNKELAEKYDFIRFGSKYYKYFISRIQKMQGEVISQSNGSYTNDKKLSPKQRDRVLAEASSRKFEGQQPGMSSQTSLANALKNIPEEDRKRFAERMASTFTRAVEQYAEKNDPGLSHNRKPNLQEQKPVPQYGPIKGRPPGKIVTIFDLSKPLLEKRLMKDSVFEDATKAASQGIPVRRVDTWTPDPLLCKRLEIETARSKEPDNESKARFKMDSVVLSQNPNEEGSTKGSEEHIQVKVEADAFLRSLLWECEGGDGEDMINNTLSDSMVYQKPMDLFQAIFDDKDDIEIPEPQSLTRFQPNEQRIQETNTVLPPSTGISMKHASKLHQNDTFGFEKFRNRSTGNDSKEQGSDRRSLSEARVQEAFQILEEAERRQKKKRERSKSHSKRKRHHKSGSKEGYHA